MSMDRPRILRILPFLLRIHEAFVPNVQLIEAPRRTSSYAKKSVIAAVSSENAHRSVTLPSRTCMISAVR